MQTLNVFVLLLAITSSSLGTPLEQRAQHEIARSPVADQPGSNHAPLTMVDDEHTGIKVMTKDDNLAAPPREFDWREKGVISPVRNQGELGDAVAWAAEECVESLLAIKQGQLTELSAPEVQDCCPQPMGENVFDCIHNFGGICSMQTYPVLTGHCRNASCQPKIQIRGGKVVPAKMVTQMTEALLINPLLALMDASDPSFEMYKGGIYSDPDCSKVQVDHAVQVVGYGEEGGKEYWICKNSWGTNWGEKGYFRILKGSDTCGIESFASYPY